jgi:hypothetical protein
VFESLTAAETAKKATKKTPIAVPAVAIIQSRPRINAPGSRPRTWNPQSSADRMTGR